MTDMLYRPALAARMAGIAVGTLRGYCLAGLVKPQMDSSGMRLFTAEQIKEIQAIYQRNIAYRDAHRGRGRKVEAVAAL